MGLHSLTQLLHGKPVQILSKGNPRMYSQLPIQLNQKTKKPTLCIEIREGGNYKA